MCVRVRVCVCVCVCACVCMCVHSLQGIENIEMDFRSDNEPPPK